MIFPTPWKAPRRCSWGRTWRGALKGGAGRPDGMCLAARPAGQTLKGAAMCDGEDTWRRLDADFASIIGRIEVVAVDTGRTVPTASAQTSPEKTGRAAHN